MAAPLQRPKANRRSAAILKPSLTQSLWNKLQLVGIGKPALQNLVTVKSSGNTTFCAT